MKRRLYHKSSMSGKKNWFEPPAAAMNFEADSRLLDQFSPNIHINKIKQRRGTL